VSWAWWDWPLMWLTNHRLSVLWHCWLGHMTRKTVSKMTYNVSSGTLNSTVPYHARTPNPNPGSLCLEQPRISLHPCLLHRGRLHQCTVFSDYAWGCTAIGCRPDANLSAPAKFLVLFCYCCYSLCYENPLLKIRIDSLFDTCVRCSCAFAVVTLLVVWTKNDS